MIDNRKGFWRAKLPRFHTEPLIFAIFKSSLNLNPKRHWSENWCPGYLEHALCSSEIHLAAAKSLEIIGHVTNCCKRPIVYYKRAAGCDTREFTKQRRQRQRERHRTKDFKSRTMAVHVRYISWYISLPSSAKQQREMTKSCVVWRT